MTRGHAPDPEKFGSSSIQHHLMMEATVSQKGDFSDAAQLLADKAVRALRLSWVASAGLLGHAELPLTL